jgi:hypothetical protein
MPDLDATVASSPIQSRTRCIVACLSIWLQAPSDETRKSGWHAQGRRDAESPETSLTSGRFRRIIVARELPPGDYETSTS